MIRLRRGEVIKDAGYDGEYGRVRLFEPGELEHGDALFDLPASVPAAGKTNAAGRDEVARRAAAADDGGGAPARAAAHWAARAATGRPARAAPASWRAPVTSRPGWTAAMTGFGRGQQTAGCSAAWMRNSGRPRERAAR